MKRRRLEKLKQEIDEMLGKPSNTHPRDLRRIAGQLGRVVSNRGKEPTYIFEPPNRLAAYPLSIPGHSKNLATGAARSILTVLSDDIERWENSGLVDEGEDAP